MSPGRTILLSTHHLDEADLLADRILILHQVCHLKTDPTNAGLMLGQRRKRCTDIKPALAEPVDCFQGRSERLAGGNKNHYRMVCYCCVSSIIHIEYIKYVFDILIRSVSYRKTENGKYDKCQLNANQHAYCASKQKYSNWIVFQGKLVCTGSPLFLKREYGSGYQLTIARDHDFMLAVSQLDIYHTS